MPENATRMPGALLGASMLGVLGNADVTGRYGTERKNHQDSAEDPRVPDRSTPVDNRGSARRESALQGGFLPVKVAVPLAEYRRLFAQAEAEGVTVAELIARKISPRKRGGARPRSGRPSGYTSLAGEEISAGRRFNMSWVEVSRQLGISEHTARAWLRKYENEVREQNMRDRAGRKAS